MDWAGFDRWLNVTPVAIAAAIALSGMIAAAALGFLLRARYEPGKDPDGQEGYVISAVLGLMALLLGFTFSIALDRFESRRALVLQEANAIGTAYLRTQLLNPPHRERISGLLLRYVDNRIALAKVTHASGEDLLAVNDQILTDLWAATSAAFQDIKGLDFSSAYIESMNNLIDLDAARKAARKAHVPGKVFAVLFLYIVVTAVAMGYVLTGLKGRVAAGFLLVLMLISLLLIIDIDRPTSGGVRESQGPMEALRASLAARPPPVFDRWLAAPAGPPKP
jgi:hypothetical protein